MARTRRDLNTMLPDAASQSGRGVARRYWLLAIVFTVLAILAAGAVASYQFAYADRIYPGVATGDGLDLGSLSRQQAAEALAARSAPQLTRELRLRYGEQEWSVTAEALGVHADVEGTVSAAYQVGRQGGILQQLADQLAARRFGRVVDAPAVALNEEQTAAYTAQLAAEIDRPTVSARLVFDPDTGARVTPSQIGRSLDTLAARQALLRALDSPSPETIALPVRELPPAIAEANVEPSRAAIAKMLSGPITMQFQDRSWTLSPKEIAGLLVVHYDALPAAPRDVVSLNEDGLAKIAGRIGAEINQDAVKPRLQLDAGQWRVLRDGRPGYLLDAKATVAAIKAAVAGDNRVVALPVQVTVPPGMGEDRAAIKELVSSATTNYGGGIAERRYNVELAAAKLNGVVVGPGEIFSMNGELGPMTLAAGFKWGYGITRVEGELTTVPSVAGGICQVATTLFQSVFWAGYQLEQRKGHSYWIDRYGQPPTGMKGLDATVDQIYDKNGQLVYAQDFQFKNTTPYPILIETKTDGARLTFNLYSTKPNWTVNVTPPQIEDVVKPDPTVVTQVDPSFAPGQQIWLEAAQDGFKSTIVRTVLEPGKEPRVYRLVTVYEPARNMVAVAPGAR